MKCLNDTCVNEHHQGHGRRFLMIPDTGLTPTQVWICEPCWKDLHDGVFMYRHVRGEILPFAKEMEHQLQENDDKGGWQGCTAEFLLSEATSHLNALKRTIKAKTLSSDEKDARIRDDAADAANFIMMIFDLWVRGSLRNEDGEEV